METAQYITLIATLIAGFGFLWKEMKSIRNESKEETRQVRLDTQAYCNGIRDEIRDFHSSMKEIHGRVCTLEAKEKE